MINYSHNYRKKEMLATKLFFVCFFFFSCMIALQPTQALVHRHKFEVRNSPITRLCGNKTILTVNGKFPGPTIYARRGDLIIVDVINLSDKNISIHWHGVKMPRNPWSDGPAYVTQCPIIPGNKFRQRVELSDEEGTLWWHAHTGSSRYTVHGALVVLPPEGQTYPFPKPHAEFPIILGEWWKNDLQEMMDTALLEGTDPPYSDAFLINGQPGDLFECSRQDTYKFRLQPGKTYLFRMISNVMEFILFFKIAGHNFTVVGADGAYLKPFTTDYIAISPGQSIDFLLEANQSPNRYYMAARVYSNQENSYMTTTGYIDYEGNYTPPPSLPLPSLIPDDVESALAGFANKQRSLANDKYPIDVPQNVTRALFYLLSMNMEPCPNGKSMCNGRQNGIRASMNNQTMVLPKTASILEAYYWGISGVYETGFPDYPLSRFDYTGGEWNSLTSRTEFGTKVSVLEYNSTVEIVLQGTDFLHGLEHPMHLHGYSFYVVGYGYGNFDPTRDPAKYNLVDPPLMETINVPRNGWTAIRFVANNPGVWFFHCHYERHMAYGMDMVFIVKEGVGPHEKMMAPPADMPWCSDPASRISRPTPAGATTNIDFF